jgi:hypothetical protein
MRLRANDGAKKKNGTERRIRKKMARREGYAEAK